MSLTSRVLQLLDHERRNLARDGETIEPLPEVTRLAIGDHRCIAWSSLTETNADAVISREIAHHRSMSAPFEWKVYAHDMPRDLAQRLALHGLTVGPCEAVMVYDLSILPAWIAAASACRVERLVDAEQLADFAFVLREVHGHIDESMLREFAIAHAAGSTDHLGYVAYIDGEPSSVGRLCTHRQSSFGGLYGGATRMAFRGRGSYRAMVAARARDALQLGAKYLLVDALPTSRPILARLGFAHLTDSWPCEYAP
jgi:hypothetical protein